MKTSKNIYFLISCIIGIFLSSYALFVELKVEKNKDYKAYCDINEYISCTKAFSSKYGKGFGIVGYILGDNSIFNQPNSLGGIIFYSVLGLISFSEKNVMVKLQIALSIVSNFFSLYLAYVLYFILHDFCLVCVGTYIINALNLALSLIKWKVLSSCKASCLSEIKKISKKNE